MPSRKPKKFCRLTKYLEVIDKDLHQTLDDLCLFSLFRTRGTRGVTFLYPSDKVYRKKIIDLAYSNTPEKAIDMIKALVIMDYLPNPLDFKNKKDDIPNSLRKKLEVDDADSTTVKLKGGLKLVLATDFKPMRSDEQVCVYKLSGKGELSTSGSTSIMKYNQGKKGGYYGGEQSDTKKSINDFVENQYTRDNHGKLVYKFIMGAVYAHIMSKEVPDELVKVYKGLCASARAEYYLIIAPFSTDNQYLINTSEICNIITEAIRNPDTWLKFCNNSESNYTSNRDAIINAVNSSMGNVDYTTQINNTYNTQMDLIKSINEPNLYKSKLINAYDTKYNSDKSYLSKDLITVYCYLASCSEWSDESYYNTTFIYVMKYIFNEPSKITSGSNDLAHNMTLYGNLIKSDAFMYVPHKSTDTLNNNYKDINEFPEPTLKQSLFSIIQSRKMSVYGGSSSAEADALFGGVGPSRAGTLEVGMGDGI
jgi:hypothetical protein